VLLADIGETECVLLADTYCAFKLSSLNEPKLTCFEFVMLSL